MIYEETGDKQGMSLAYINMGIIYRHEGNFEQALAYYEKSLKIKEEIDDKRGMANSYCSCAK